MEYRFSLTPRLVAVGLFSLVALFVLLFLLGMQVGIRTAKVADASPASASPVSDPLAAAKQKAAEAEATLRQVSAPAHAAPTAPSAVTSPAAAVSPADVPAAKH